MTRTPTFKPAWWLNNCHLQTLYPALFRRVPLPPDYKRERLVTPDDDFIDIDFCGEGSGPLVILLHGLTGSSQSDFIKGLQHALYAQGLRSVALNFRGCSGQSNNRARCYHSGETEDIHFLYKTLRQREPETLIAAVGISLGGNVLLKWLGEQGNHVNLFASVAISVPLVLSVCATKLDSGFAKIYRASLLKELKDYMKVKQRHLLEIGHQEDEEKLKAIGDLSNVSSFWEYDDRVVAPLHGFKNVHDYYQRASSRQFLKSIAIPTLVIQAIDDPFMTREVLPEQDEISPFVQLEFSQSGGHVGFVSGNNPFRPLYWLDQRIPAFLLENL